MRIGRLFGKIKRKKQLPDSLSTSNHWISFWTAGLKYDSRDLAVRKCNINEIVVLEREPENFKDENAIHVKRQNGESLGYVGRNRAMQIAPLLDQKSISPFARIVALKCDIVDNIYGVKIAVGVNSQIFNLLSPSQRKIEFLFDTSDQGNLYLLLDCEENTLDQIIRLLSESDIEILRSGISYRPGSDGMLYSWYLRLENDIIRSDVESLLRDNFPVLQERYDQSINEEYFEIQEEEITDLKSKNKNLLIDLQRAKDKLERYSKNQLQRGQDFIKLIGLTFPNVNFLRDSLDMLQNEIQDYSDPLKKTLTILNNPTHRGKKINTLSQWWELHFNTGQRDDGRLYFKREDGKLSVLVSFKKTQKKDISYLKNY